MTTDDQSARLFAFVCHEEVSKFGLVVYAESVRDAIVFTVQYVRDWMSPVEGFETGAVRVRRCPYIDGRISVAGAVRYSDCGGPRLYYDAGVPFSEFTECCGLCFRPTTDVIEDSHLAKAANGEPYCRECTGLRP